MDIKIIPASVEDCAILTQIAKKAKQHWGYSDAWIELWEDDLAITPLSFKTSKVNKGIVGDALVGFYVVKDEGELIELDGLWVLPEYHGKGFGKKLFHHAIDQARITGHRYLQLYADPHVDLFYQKLGGQIIGKIQTKIKDRYLNLFQFPL